jgi:hypothetical protein
MLRKNNFYLFLLAELFFLFFMLIIIPSFFLKEKPGISQLYFENILSLNINSSHIQPFISDRNNLNSVSVLLKNPALKSNDQVKLELQNKNKEPIQSLEISGKGIEDPGWVKLKFYPINSQKGDIFYIKVTSNAQKDNNLYIYGNKENNNINFRTTYKSPNLINSLKDNFNNQLDRFTKLNKIQTTFYSTILLITNILLFFSL